MLDNFFTIVEHEQAEITEKKSVFIANIFPNDSIDIISFFLFIFFNDQQTHSECVNMMS